MVNVLSLSVKMDGLWQVFILGLICSVKACIHGEGQVVDANVIINDINFELTRLFDEEKKRNYVYSSYSLMSAVTPMLALLEDGTRKKVEKCLGSTYNSLENFISTNKKNSNVFNEATRIWMDSGVQVNKKKMSKLSENIKSYIKRLDIKTEPTEARNRINHWVLERTHGMIKDFLPSDAIDSSTKMVITNAISFRGNWKLPFDQSATRNQKFHVSQDKVIDVPMMANTVTTKYYKDANFKMLEMPYSGDKYSMFIVLPRRKKESSTFSFDTKSVMGAIPKMMEMKIKVILPKFKMSSSFNMRKHMTDMGLQSLFSKVDILDEYQYFSEIIHKVNVVMDENGTEASAATGVLTARMILPQFRANRPFHFMIMNLETNAILFSGKISNPKWD